MFAIARRFWWPAMEPDVKEYVEACPVCARNKSSTRSRMGLLQPLPIPSRPWAEISMDFVMGLPVSQGNTTVLTVVDRFSKMVRFIALPKLPPGPLPEAGTAVCGAIPSLQGHWPRSSSPAPAPAPVPPSPPHVPCQPGQAGQGELHGPTLPGPSFSGSDRRRSSLQGQAAACGPKQGPGQAVPGGLGGIRARGETVGPVPVHLGP
uniref:translation initiation factor IF-2-like n=1 Tax=Solea senegalensis TaxID=28829 RepID=UPI001CD82F7C|nr:translation initiation factor IF-2-like [Solea senegalensis]